MKFADVQQMKESTLKKFIRMPQFDEHWRCTASIAFPATAI